MSLQLEAVEPRRLLSVVLEDGTLHVSATESADRITVGPLRMDASTLRVSFNGRIQRFALADVQLVVIDGGAGNDTIILSGLKIKSQVNGGHGADRIDGGANQDVIDGADGNDIIRGGAGDDDLRGSDGNDRVFGEAGNDFVGGGDGIDRIFGGRGADQFGALGTQEERKDFNERDGDSVQRFSSGGGATLSFAPIVGSVSAPIIPSSTARLDLGTNTVFLDYPGSRVSGADLMPAGQAGSGAVPIADLVALWQNLGSAEFDRLISTAFGAR